ncbi:MAG TPA: hypothetical protein H9968_02250 [Candidatus Anaerobutyricum stercoris]|uniref:VCBS repeat-containing protein n=1 Tax=Candidatus Anaerobutyricum stercoris TaxID=2838457 RepID=A0A9D2J6R8_9FIRM|nr:hypothetical protein [Candidatus Anaerobutyricum stercoris]
MGRLKKSVAGATLCAGVVFGCMAMAFPTSAADAASTSLQDIGTQKVSVQAKKMNKKNWYKKVLKRQKGSYKVRCWNYQYSYAYKTIRTNVSSYSYYKAADINKDGTKELLLSTNSTGRGYQSKVLVLTFRKGKVKPLIAFEELRNGLFLRGKKMYAQVGGSTESIITGYKVNKGKAKQFVKLERLRRWPNGSSDAVTTYWKNGAQITETQYNAECMKSVAYRTPLSFSRFN